jgi:hypothetical protein
MESSFALSYKIYSLEYLIYLIQNFLTYKESADMARSLEQQRVAHSHLEVVRKAVLPFLNAFSILDQEAFVPLPRDW